MVKPVLPGAGATQNLKCLGRPRKLDRNSDGPVGSQTRRLGRLSCLQCCIAQHMLQCTIGRDFNRFARAWLLCGSAMRLADARQSSFLRDSVGRTMARGSAGLRARSHEHELSLESWQRRQSRATSGPRFHNKPLCE